MASDYPQTAKWGAEAFADAKRLGDRALRATAAGMLAIGQCFDGMSGDAREGLTLAAELLDGLSDDELGTMHCCASVGWAEHCAERYQHARRHLQRGIDVSRASGHGYYIVALLSAQSLVLTALGLLHEAQHTADTAVDAARLSGSPLEIAWALASQSLAATFRGDLATARAAAEESLVVGKEADATVPVALGGWALATAVLEAGDSDRVVSVLVDAAGGEDLPMTWSATRSLCYRS